VSAYTIYVTPTAWDEVKALPGHIRQRVRRAITALADAPRPSESKALVHPIQEAVTSARAPAASTADEPVEPVRELRRIRLERWRIVYAVTETDQAIDVLPVRKRPPYDYGDLERLLAEL
jgi:mRNA interferase RelE/StbE